MNIVAIKETNPAFALFQDGWPSEGTVCGWGSELSHTVAIREALPLVVERYGIGCINDLGCGDLHWIQQSNIGRASYVGYDLFRRPTWSGLEAQGWKVVQADITEELLPPADLAICRDVFIHLSNDLVLKTLALIRARHRFLLATTFTSADDRLFSNDERIAGVSIHHSKIDLRLPPFGLGEPIYSIAEDYPHKACCLWRLR